MPHAMSKKQKAMNGIPAIENPLRSFMTMPPLDGIVIYQSDITF
jgi:hypothetical protein